MVPIWNIPSRPHGMPWKNSGSGTGGDPWKKKQMWALKFLWGPTGTHKGLKDPSRSSYWSFLNLNIWYTWNTTLEYINFLYSCSIYLNTKINLFVSIKHVLQPHLLKQKMKNKITWPKHFKSFEFIDIFGIFKKDFRLIFSKKKNYLHTYFNLL
jgi:hypothetical protein